MAAADSFYKIDLGICALCYFDLMFRIMEEYCYNMIIIFEVCFSHFYHVIELQNPKC